MKSLPSVGGRSGRLFVSLLVGCVAMATTVQAQFYLHLKSARHEQTSSAAPVLLAGGQLPWSEMVAVMGFAENSFSAVTFTRPGSAAEPLHWSVDDEQWGLAVEPEFATKAELNALAPDSASPYVFSFTPTGGSPVTSPLVMNGDAYASPPHVTNYDAAQAIDPAQDFALTWAPFVGGTASDIILVFINGQQDHVFSTPLPGQPGQLTGTATSVTIPANTLVAGTTYQCEVLFLKTVDQRTGDLAGANGLSAYESNTQLTIQAVTPPPPPFYLLGKAAAHTQTSAGAATLNDATPWQTILVAIGFEDGDFTGINVQRPGLSPVALQWSAAEGMWGQPTDEEFATEGALDAQYPNSATPYSFGFTPAGGGAVVNSPLVLNGAAYPAAPHVSNFAAAQAIDPAQPFTLTWDAFAGGTAGDAILVFINGSNDNDVFSTPFPGAPGALNGTATSVQIPAGTFQPGRTYECEILFLNIVDTRATDLAGTTGYAGYFGITGLSLATAGTAVGPTSTEFHLQFSHTQGSIVGSTVYLNFPVTTYYNPVFVAFDDPNPPTSVTFTGPAGSQLEGGVPSIDFNQWSQTGRAFFASQRTTGPTPANHPPGGVYSVGYGGGAPYNFDLTDPESDVIQVVALPTFTINGSNQLTAVNWTLRTPAGVATTVPTAFLSAAVTIGVSGGSNIRLETTPDANSVTLPSAISWPAVQWIDISFDDDLRHFYRSGYSVVAPVAPNITGNPLTQTVTAGGQIVLNVTATGTPAPTYQWQYNSVDIAGATSSSYTVPSVQQFHAGSYRVVVTNSVSSATSNAATLTVNPAPSSPARLLNLSTRAVCLTGDNVLIPGFVIQGPGNKELLIRGVGPTLGGFGVTGTLPNPRLTLKRFNPAIPPSGGYEDVETNDNWGTNANSADIITTAADLFAFPLDSGSNDAALLVTLEPGQYSVVTSDVTDQVGISIVELYDADPGSSASRLINISNRGFVGVGNSIMIPGFVVSNEGPKTLLIRAVGPTLGGFGVPDVLADPTLTIYRHNFSNNTDELLLTNDDWDVGPGASQTATVASQVLAFPLTAASTDAAFVVTLQPGVYTVHARGKADATGVALVELYVVP